MNAFDNGDSGIPQKRTAFTLIELLVVIAVKLEIPNEPISKRR
jgi:hypothetical protein